MKYLLYYNTKHDFDVDKGKDSDSLSYVEDVDSCYFNVPKEVPYVKLTFADGTTRTDEYSNGIIPDSKYNSTSSIVKAEIGDGITSIGNFAFQYCDDLTSVTMSNTVTSCGNRTFDNCDVLETINISSGMTEIPELFVSACSSLSSVTIPSSITSICEFSFAYCSSLTDGNFKFSGTTAQFIAISKGDEWANYVAATKVTCTDGCVSIEDDTVVAC